MKFLKKYGLVILIVLVIGYLVYQAYLGVLTAIYNAGKNIGTGLTVVGTGLVSAGNAPASAITALNNALFGDVSSIWNWLAGTGSFTGNGAFSGGGGDFGGTGAGGSF